MDLLVLKPIKSEIQYLGEFSELAFDMLSAPIPLYKSLLKNLGKYGATTKDLNIYTMEISEANVSCPLVSLDALVRVRLDKLEVNFLDLGKIGQELASEVLVDVYEALQNADSSISVSYHTISIKTQAQGVNATYLDLIRKFISSPPSLSEQTTGGVAFYLVDDQPKGVTGGSIIIDRSTLYEEGVYISITANFDASLVPIKSVREKVTEYHAFCLEHLNIKFEEE